MKALLSKLIRRAARDYPKRSVEFDALGFVVCEEEKAPLRMEWNVIDEIYTRKVDLFSYDEVRLGFAHISANLVLELGEHHEGFPEFSEEVLRRYPSISSSWFTDVAFPAFEANFRTLWERNENQGA